MRSESHDGGSAKGKKGKGSAGMGWEVRHRCGREWLKERWEGITLKSGKGHLRGGKGILEEGRS